MGIRSEEVLEILGRETVSAGKVCDYMRKHLWVVQKAQLFCT